jgi:hypothetical protein
MGRDSTPVRATKQAMRRPRAYPEPPLTWEPPRGIEPLTYSLRVNRSGRLS